MSGTYSKHVEGDIHTWFNFGWKTWREENLLWDLDGRIILKQILKDTGCEDINWIQLTWHRVIWWNFVKVIMTLWVSQK